MYDAEMIEHLAAIAHDLWCARMRDKGWRTGDRYSQPQRVHDALVAFNQLSAIDRRSVLVAARSVADHVADAVDYPRGTDRELLAEEMKEGLAVGWARGAGRASSPSTSASEVGQIQGWEVEPGTPFLRLIRVRWPGGEETEHDPRLRELRRR
jgi:hypothetical protein